MTDQASTKTAARRTRRQLLAGGTGALAAVLAAEAIARPAPAAADDGDPVLLGQVNTATSETTMFRSQGPALTGQCDSGAAIVAFGTDEGLHGNGIIGVHGIAAGAGALIGVQGDSETSIGVLGNASNGATGVFGDTDRGIGVHGQSESGHGVLGHSNGGDGVRGESGATGVHGIGIVGGTGVLGASGTGTGVEGSSGSGAGVRGGSGSGVGVAGVSGSGTGARASGQTALDVQGRAVFSRSGTVSISAGASSIGVRGVPLTAASIVLVTAQNDVPGAAVRSAVPDPAGGLFTVHLAHAVNAAVKVGWFIVN